MSPKSAPLVPIEKFTVVQDTLPIAPPVSLMMPVRVRHGRRSGRGRWRAGRVARLHVDRDRDDLLVDDPRRARRRRVGRSPSTARSRWRRRRRGARRCGRSGSSPGRLRSRDPGTCPSGCPRPWGCLRRATGAAGSGTSAKRSRSMRCQRLNASVGCGGRRRSGTSRAGRSPARRRAGATRRQHAGRRLVGAHPADGAGRVAADLEAAGPGHVERRVEADRLGLALRPLPDRVRVDRTAAFGAPAQVVVTDDGVIVVPGRIDPGGRSPR